MQVKGEDQTTVSSIAYWVPVITNFCHVSLYTHCAQYFLLRRYMFWLLLFSCSCGMEGYSVLSTFIVLYHWSLLNNSLHFWSSDSSRISIRENYVNSINTNNSFHFIYVKPQLIICCLCFFSLDVGLTHSGFFCYRVWNILLVIHY